MSTLVPLFVWASGAFLVLGLLRGRGSIAPPWLVALALGPAAGFGLLSIAYFAWRLVGFSAAGFQLAGWAGLTTALGLGLLLARRPSTRPTRKGFPRTSWIAVGLMIGTLSLAAIAVVLYCRQLPHGSFDAWAIWTSRARLLNRGTDLPEIFSILRRAHPDYPLLLPGSLAALFSLAGSESPRIPQLTSAMFLFSTALAVVVGALELGAARRWALLAGALLLSTPKFLFWGAVQGADVPLGYSLLLATVFLSALFDRARAPLVPAVAVGFLVGLPAWTKNEGMILSALLVALFLAAVALTARGGRSRRLVLPVLAGALPPWLALALFRLSWKPGTDLGFFVGDLWARLGQPDRWRTVGAAFGEQLSPVAGFHSWGIVWLVAVIALALGLLLRRPVPPTLLLGRLILLCCWLAWFAVFIGTPHDIQWHLQSALDRLLLQLLPLTLTLGFAGLTWRRRLAGTDETTPRGVPAAAVTLLAATLLVGCGGGPQTAGPDAIRLIEQQPVAVLDEARLLREIEAAAWDFELATDPAAGWVVTSGIATAAPDGLSLTPDDRGRATVERHLSIDAAVVDVLRFVRPEVSGGALSVLWAGPGQHFTSDRRLEVQFSGGRDQPRQDIVMATRGLPEWTGPITQLRLDYRNLNPSRPPIRLRRLMASRRRIDDSALGAMAGSPRRAELDHERRSVFVGAQGSPLLWDLPEPAEHELRFGFGTEASIAGVTTFRVFSGVGSRSAEVFTATVGPREGTTDHASDRWHDVVLPAESLAGATRIRFEIEYPRAEAERSALAFWSNPTLHRTGGKAKRPDILLVSIDTLRPDHLSLYGYDKSTSPELDRWARSAVVFEKTVTTAPWTLPAHLSLFTGLDAVHHGVNHRGRVPNDLTLLAESLRDAGYTTLAVTGGGYLDPEFGLDQGFDRYRYWPHHTAEEELVSGIDTAARWLAEQPRQPLFLFFHTYEVHHPYRPRSPYFERFAAGAEAPLAGALGYISLPQEEAAGYLLTKQWRANAEDGSQSTLDAEQRRLLTALYDSGIAFADAQIGRLLARWDAREGADQAVVAITSDHGEALGEKDVAGHAYLEDFNALVPLVVRLPGGRNAGRVSSQVRLIDLAPTLLELAGLEAAAGSDGISLLRLAEEGGGDHRPGWTYSPFSNRGLALRLGDRWKYTFNDTVWQPLHGQEALYDLRRDPSEQSPLPTDPQRMEALRTRAGDHLTQMALAIRIRIENPSPMPVSGRLIGGVLGPSHLKSTGLPHGGLERQPASAIDLRAESGEVYELLLESPPPGQLTVSLDPGFRQTIDLRQLDATWQAARGVDGWALTDGSIAERSTPTVTVEWTGGAASVTSDPAAGDDALRRQLEALGYIE